MPASTSSVSWRTSVGSSPSLRRFTSSIAGSTTFAVAALTKLATKVTMHRPPLAGSLPRIASGTLRGTSHTARADEWLKMIGAAEVSRASAIVAGDTCEQSTSIPMRFISRTTSRPKGARPPWRGASVAESAQSVVALWVRVRYPAPSSRNMFNVPSEPSITCPPSMPSRLPMRPAAMAASTSSAVRQKARSPG